MLFSLLLPLMSLPAVLFTLLGIWILSGRRESERDRIWPLFLLVSAIILALPLAVFSVRILTRDVAYPLWLEIPVLISVLVLLLLNGRRLYTRWLDDRVPVTGLLLALILIFTIMAIQEPSLLLFLLVPAGILAGGWALGCSLGHRGLVSASVVLVILFVLDGIGLVTHPIIYRVPVLRTAYGVAGPLSLILGLGFAALLIERGMRAARTGDDRQAWLISGLAFTLIISLAGVMFRLGVLIKATGHAAEDHMPLGLVIVGVIIGLLASFGQPERRARLGLPYAVLVPFLIAFAYAAGGLIDPDAVTASRAERIDQAVSRYHQDTGVYPANLTELTPNYDLYLLGPLTGRGMAWCYQSGPDYYRLGYAYHQRYYEPTIPDPFSEIRVYRESGQPPSGRWMCDEELELIIATRGL
jgi:multidrug transporter EmrE-like cation transporter